MLSVSLFTFTIDFSTTTTTRAQNIVGIESSCAQCSLVNPNDKSAPPKTFSFDGAYYIDSATEQIYNEIVFPIVEVGTCLQCIRRTLLTFCCVWGSRSPKATMEQCLLMARQAAASPSRCRASTSPHIAESYQGENDHQLGLHFLITFQHPQSF